MDYEKTKEFLIKTQRALSKNPDVLDLRIKKLRAELMLDRLKREKAKEYEIFGEINDNVIYQCQLITLISDINSRLKDKK